MPNVVTRYIVGINILLVYLASRAVIGYLVGKRTGERRNSHALVLPGQCAPVEGRH